MLEILIISILISVWLFAVRKAMDHAKWTNMGIMQRIIANQLATEWAEILYQTRNTNFLQYYYNENYEKEPIEINNCRLAYNYQTCYNYSHSSSATCPADTEHCTDASRYVLQSWYYYIENDWWKNTIRNCLCEDTIDNCSNIKNDKYAICLNNWVREPCPQWHEGWDDQSKYWKFYRMIQWIWVYNMSSPDIWWEPYASSFCMWHISAQEYRFCSRVARDGWQWWELEICSTMTNFAEIEWTVVR